MAKTSTGTKVAEGLGATAALVGAAALGYYFYGSDKAVKHRKIAAKWARDMKQEVLAETKRLKKVSPKAVALIVDSVAKTYQDVKNVDKAELKRAARELKSNWKKVQMEAAPAVAKAKKKVVKLAKKVKGRA